MLSFTRIGLRDYFLKFERSSLDRLAEVTSLDVRYPSLVHSLYGRNSVSKTGRVGECDPEAVETWSISGYDSLGDILDAAIRHDHEAVIRWLKRVATFSLDIVPSWIEKFGMPPGEDARFEPCEDRQRMFDEGEDGDTDIYRGHFSGYGLCRLLISPEVRESGPGAPWPNVALRAFGLSLLRWLEKDAAKMFSRRREYLRYGTRLSTLAGLVELFTSIGETDLATHCFESMRAFVNWAFEASNLTEAAGLNGDVWALYTYGDFRWDERTKKFGPAFPYGYFPHGGQSWYYGILCRGLVRAAGVAAGRGEMGFVGVTQNIFGLITKWIDPIARRVAPPVSLGIESDEVGLNSLLQGGKKDPTADPWISDVDVKERRLLRISDLEQLNPDQEFLRWSFVNQHEADPDAYWAAEYTDPVGGTHKRAHGIGSGRAPSLPPLDVTNGYGLPGALWLRGKIRQNDTLVRWAEILTGAFLAFAHTSDLGVKREDAIDEDVGMSPALNSVGMFGRSYHWAWQIGPEVRKELLAGQADGDATDGERKLWTPQE